MRTIYLIRHGKVKFPDGIRRCIGRTDLPLDETGRQQARDLNEYFKTHPVERVYCSPLWRSAETAMILGGWEQGYAVSQRKIPVYMNQALQEQDMGEWEDVPMMDLKKTLEQEPERGERRADARARMTQAMYGLLDETQGDIAVVSHAGINCCFLSGIIGSPLAESRLLFQPYGGISKIAAKKGWDGSYSFSLLQLGRMPKLYPSDEECEEILEHYQTPEHVRRHCGKVAHLAKELGNMQIQMGISLNQGLIRSASLLHDIARHHNHHTQEGADLLMREGYPAVADIIRQHHCLDKEVIDEAAIVYLADKLIQGERLVTLEERFRGSASKCGESREAWEAHETRKEQAYRIAKMMWEVHGRLGTCTHRKSYAIME